LCEDTGSWPRSCWHLPSHDDSAASSATSLGLPQHCGISPRCGTSLRCGSNQHLCSASAAVSVHPCGSLGLCENLPHSDHLLRRNPRAWFVRGHGQLAIRLLAPAWSRPRPGQGLPDGPRALPLGFCRRAHQPAGVNDGNLRDSAPPAGHNDSSVFSALSLVTFGAVPRDSVVTLSQFSLAAGLNVDSSSPSFN